MRRDDDSIVALVLYGLLTVVLAWALVQNIDSVLAGQNSDLHINLWADWWTKKALTEGLDLFHTDYLFYPQGVSLAFHSFSHVNTVITLLLTPLVGHFAAYNATILLTFALSGFSMYLLVEHLTGCRPAAFVAGLIFAFHPYHRFESAHPVIVTTQWMPLFALALVRTVHGENGRRGRNVVLTVLWFVLTALSSWHLMFMLLGWIGLYALYDLLVARNRWARGTWQALAISALIAGLVLSPILWPTVSEALSSGKAYLSAESDEGIGNDVLGFLVPNRANPLLYPPVARLVDINDQTSFTGKRSAYLGYVPLALTVVASATAHRARFWVAGGLLSLLLSLGARITFNSVPLHEASLPWAAPITRVLRHPSRLNVLTFFFLSVAAGFGVRWVHRALGSRKLPFPEKSVAYASTFVLAGLILVEYAVVPFPTMQLPYPPFLHELAEEPGDFAVIDFPMGRQKGKRYQFYQTVHGKRIAGGHVSRKPDTADAFIDGNPLLERLDDEEAPGPSLDVREEFENLADHGFRYLIVHKRFLSSEDAQAWKSWFPFPPSHEDSWLIVYPIPAKPTTGAGTAPGTGSKRADWLPPAAVATMGSGRKLP